MHIKEKEEVLVEMQKPVSLKERSRDHVKIRFLKREKQRSRKNIFPEHTG